MAATLWKETSSLRTQGLREEARTVAKRSGGKRYVDIFSGMSTRGVARESDQTLAQGEDAGQRLPLNLKSGGYGNAR